MGGNSQIVNLPPMENDPRRRRPDISLAKRVLGWEPRVSFADGLRSTIEFFRREIDHHNGSDDANPASKIDRWTERPVL